MVLSKLIALFAPILGVEESGLSARTHFRKAGNIESIDVVQVIIAAERAFQITVHDEDAGAFHTLGDLAEYIEERIAEEK